jgi:hypothetical protein
VRAVSPCWSRTCSDPSVRSPRRMSGARGSPAGGAPRVSPRPGSRSVATINRSLSSLRRPRRRRSRRR